jgi:hypothetical protein
MGEMADWFLESEDQSRYDEPDECFRQARRSRRRRSEEQNNGESKTSGREETEGLDQGSEWFD